MAGLSRATKWPRGAKCSTASAGVTDAVGNAEVTAHGLGDLAEGDALVADRVQDRAGRGGLDGQAGQAGGVGAVHGRPAVGAVTHVAGHAALAGDADEGGHEAVVAVAVDRRGEAQHRRADADARAATA